MKKQGFDGIFDRGRESVLAIVNKSEFYLGITVFALLAQWVVIAITTVNLPQADEWENLVENALPSGFSWKYLFAFHNEHRVVFTKLMNYVFLYLTDWNMKYQIIANYLVWFSVVLFLLYVQRKYIPKATKGLWFLVFFLASPLLIENHNWGFQNCFHFFLLFGLLSVFVLSQRRMSENHQSNQLGLRALIASVLALLSLYSFAAGMFFGLICLAMMTFILIRERGVSKVDIVMSLFAIGILLGGMGLWFVGYEKPVNHPVFVPPYAFAFWTFLTNLISFGFGYKTSSIPIGFVAGGIVFFVLWKSWRKALWFREPYFVFAFFSSLALLGAFVSITLSRAGFGLGQAKTSRYGEIGVLLMVLVGWLFWDYCRESQIRAKAYKYFIWFILLGFVSDYSYSGYFTVEAERKESLACVLKYYQGENPKALCPATFPISLADKLEVARRMGLSWVPKGFSPEFQEALYE
jgi:hypothetical protein